MKNIFLYFLLLFALGAHAVSAQSHIPTTPNNDKRQQWTTSVLSQWFKSSREENRKPSVPNTFRQHSAFKANTISEQLDSVVFAAWSSGQQLFQNKEEFSFDSYGNLTSEAYYSWDSFNNEWLGDYKESKVFDWNGSLLSNTIYQWNDVAEAWENDYKTEWTYNAFGSIIRTTEFLWNGSAWIPNSKDEFVLNAAGLPTEALTFFWDDNAGAWGSQAVFKTEFTYNINNYELSRTNAFWNGLQWQNIDKTEKTYTSSGLVISESNYYWDSGNSVWMGSFRTQFSYDVISLLMLNEIRFQWDVGLSVWSESDKIEYAYDAFGNNTEEVYYYWDSGQWEPMDKNEQVFNTSNLMTQQTSYWWNNGSWEPDFRASYVFDASDNIQELILSAWTFGVNLWQDFEKYELAYDFSVNAEDILYPPFLMEDISFTNKLLDVRKFDFMNSQWEFIEQYDYYYSPATITSTENKVEAVIKVFPNPAADNFMIVHEFQEAVALELFDLAGKKVMSTDVQNHQPVSIQGLTNGLYLLKITGKNNQTHTQRLVVQQ